ncbi:hypothetical protein [uncultured Flavonifractor sp.]|uniref:hypothetical protein n=1 Tax=uncultured Flavonifractor sp. TaxID=1193534 RepID=UPI0026180576|nr:hypothetical protein [uncultured Flavonifractor sp.]
MRNIIPENGYLVYADTHDRVVFYECDPSKNTECSKTMCRAEQEEDEGSFGFCAKTTEPKFRKEGGRSWYAVQKTPEDGEPYWGREYIEGV